MRSRSSASSAMLVQGCSTYSRSNGASAWIARSASSTFHPAFASTRIRPSGPISARTARTRATSSARAWPASATLTFAVRHPSKRASTDGTCSAGTAGTVALTGMRSRSAAGRGCHASAIAASSQVAASASPYSTNGENSAHPSRPSNSSASRTSTPRNRVCIGSATTRAVCRISARAGRSVMPPSCTRGSAPMRQEPPGAGRIPNAMKPGRMRMRHKLVSLTMVCYTHYRVQYER
ncbi:exported hypothetical protein [Microbacterium sp. 8M]|nr:exported hypothetical protein [Microbacterium sp. 8M]